MLRRVLMQQNAYISKEETPPQVNNLRFYHKKLEKWQQKESNSKQKKELIKIRAPTILTLGSMNGWLGPEPLGRAGMSLEGQIWFCECEVDGNKTMGWLWGSQSFLFVWGFQADGTVLWCSALGSLSSCPTVPSGKRFALLGRTPSTGLSAWRSWESSLELCSACCLGSSAGAQGTEGCAQVVLQAQWWMGVFPRSGTKVQKVNHEIFP